MLVQPGLWQTCSETTLLVFPRGGSYVNTYTKVREVGCGVCRHIRKQTICICENKDADQLCSNFVFATQIVQSFFYLNPKKSLVYAGPGRKLKLLVFSCGGSSHSKNIQLLPPRITLIYMLNVKVKTTFTRNMTCLAKEEHTGPEIKKTVKKKTTFCTMHYEKPKCKESNNQLVYTVQYLCCKRTRISLLEKHVYKSRIILKICI